SGWCSRDVSAGSPATGSTSTTKAGGTRKGVPCERTDGLLMAPQRRGALLSLAQGRQESLRHCFVLLVLGRPFGIDGRVEDALELGHRFALAIHVEQRLGQEVARDRAVRIVGERAPQVLF